MEEQDVIRRLKGLGRGATPPAPDFADATLPTPVASPRGVRLGMAPLAAVVGILALGTAALAVPQGGPLRQAVAGFTTDVEANVETDLAEVDADLDGDDSGVSGSVGANPCEGPPPAPTGTAVPGTEGAEGSASVEADLENREAQLRAWQEWREANCGTAADSDEDSNDDSDDDEGRKDDREKGDRGKGEKSGDRGKSGERRPDSHSHEDDPCKGPPPHSNKPGTGDPERDEAQRKAEQEAWHQWHKENCPPGQTGDHPNGGSGQGRPDDAGKPDDAGRPEGKGEGRPEGSGRPEGRP